MKYNDSFGGLHSLCMVLLLERCGFKPQVAFSSTSSDDDLTPYDMSGDQEMNQASPPRYLRDCLDGMAGPDETLFIQYKNSINPLYNQ